ncbi:MAG: DNA-binding response regulator [Runella slithyformis]|nr:MAG: DNA-binding response regulator [Runella slithyformis]
MNSNATVALIDDHTLIRNALKELINQFEDFAVTIDAANGQDFIAQLKVQPAPHIALVDINMPILDGFATTAFLTQNYPQIKVLALTVNDDDESIIKMLRAGAVGYLLKDTEPAQLKTALYEVNKNGFYHTELVNNVLVKSLKQRPMPVSKPLFGLQRREEDFLKWCCTELTYKEIADRMCVSPRTIDGYRDALFEKLRIKSRVGLALFSLRNGIVNL